jgi:hypothetical protein
MDGNQGLRTHCQEGLLQLPHEPAENKGKCFIHMTANGEFKYKTGEQSFLLINEYLPDSETQVPVKTLMLHRICIE